MSRHLLALAVTTALATTLAGCGGSDDSNTGTTTAGTTTAGGSTTTGTTTTGTTTTGATTGGGTTTTGTTTGGGPIGNPTAPTGGGAPDGSTKAGSYIGDFGFGDGYEQGVFVVDNDFNLSGLALSSDGSAKSVFGELGSEDTFEGNLREYDHQASQSTSGGSISFGVSGMPSVIGPLGLTFVNGQSIEGSDARGVSLVLASGGQLMPATTASVAGTWTAENQYTGCDDPAVACQLFTELTFSGVDVTGRTYLTNPATGSISYENPITGIVAEFGDVLLVNLNWGTPANDNENAYSGTVYFAPDGTGRLVYAVESGEESANPRVLAAVLTRQ